MLDIDAPVQRNKPLEFVSRNRACACEYCCGRGAGFVRAFSLEQGRDAGQFQANVPKDFSATLLEKELAALARKPLRALL